jgi:hypothetical protein
MASEMDKGRGAVSIALSIVVSIGVAWPLVGPGRHFLETCRPQGKAGVPVALFDL